MRAGLNTIQQTLTPEASSVLNHSIAEASRRNHGQTTPLHVAATLLASPSGFLRQACIKSHPNSSHPLQCRALELCFSVALERLPTAQNMSPGMEPPISNALMAALKRAQAHQRRGFPEQQQPLLAVKVELEQLIISILDDPSVSRVMREASFSSPAVKATIEQSLNSTSPAVNSSPMRMGVNFRSGSVTVATANRVSYLNPRLQQGGSGQSGSQRGEDVKRVIDVLLRGNKRNPVLVGESEPEAVIREALRRIENEELGDEVLKNVEVIRLEKDLAFDKAQLLAKVKELVDLVEARIGNLNGGGIVIDLGDLKWLVEHHSCFGAGMVQQFVAEVMRPAVAEMGRLLMKFGEGSGGRVWFVGTATCETYLRCQVYHPTMEIDWDLHAMPIAARGPVPGLFPRIGTNGLLSSSVDSLSPLKGLPAAATLPQSRVLASCCAQCLQNYEQELKLVSKEFEKSSVDVQLGDTRPPLPQWLQNAKAHDGDFKTKDQSLTKDQELIFKHKTQALHKKWVESCTHQHNFIKPFLSTTPSLATTLCNPKLLGLQPSQPKLQLNSGDIVQFSSNSLFCQPSIGACKTPGSPLKTDLVLGCPKSNETIPAKSDEVTDFLGCISPQQQNRVRELQSDKPVDTDSFKRLLKGVIERVWWQREAASAVATTVTQCKLGRGKSRGGGTKGDMWLMFTGPDRVGKKKMASALSELICGSNLITICLGSRRNHGESDLSYRGKTALDRVVEAVRRNPCSVIMLEDIDEADMVVRGNIKRAMERGRLGDSHGREISLGNVIFVLTTDWLPENIKFLSSGISLDEEKLMRLARSGWQLKLSVCEKTTKRHFNWQQDEVRAMKPRKETGLSFDLNESADVEADGAADGSGNSSDLTNEHEDDHRRSSTTSSAPQEMLNSVDDAIVFKPVDFGPIRRDIANSITKKISAIIKNSITIEVQEDALEKILSGVWLGCRGLEEWMETTLLPSLFKLKEQLPITGATSRESIVVRLESDGNSHTQRGTDWLTNSINVVVADGL